MQEKWLTVLILITMIIIYYLYSDQNAKSKLINNAVIFFVGVMLARGYWYLLNKYIESFTMKMLCVLFTFIVIIIAYK